MSEENKTYLTCTLVPDGSDIWVVWNYAVGFTLYAEMWHRVYFCVVYQDIWWVSGLPQQKLHGNVTKLVCAHWHHGYKMDHCQNRDMNGGITYLTKSPTALRLYMTREQGSSPQLLTSFRATCPKMVSFHISVCCGLDPCSLVI